MKVGAGSTCELEVRYEPLALSPAAVCVVTFPAGRVHDLL